MQLIKSSVRDCINIKSGVVNGTKAGDRRMLFMPHSAGIYVALVLKDAAQIETELEEDQDTVSAISAVMLQKQDSMNLLKDDDQSN